MTKATFSTVVLVLFVASVNHCRAEKNSNETNLAQEMAKFEGVWSMSASETNGRTSPVNQLSSWVLVVEGDQYNPGSGEMSIEYTFRIDPKLTPKVIDLIPNQGLARGRSFRGIYILEGELLTICRALEPEGERPAGFNTRPNSRTTKVIWKRKKP